MRRDITLKDQTVDVALPMASLPLSTSAPAKRTKSKSKRGSLLRRVTKRNARAQEVREIKAKNPLASQKVIAGQLELQRSTEILYTESKYLSLPADIAEGDVTPAATTTEILAPETPEVAGVSKAESLCLTPQKHMTLSHSQKISHEEASKAFEVLLKFCFEQRPGFFDVKEGVMLGQWMKRLQTIKRSD